MEDKKAHIIKNVGKLYLKFGIKSVTMDDVAREFAISKKTLYQYFTDKADLVSQVIDYYLKDQAIDMNNNQQGNAIDQMFDIRLHVAKIFKFFNNTIEYDLKKLYPKLYTKIHNTKRERIFSNTIKNIESGKKQQLFREELNPDLIAKLQIGRMLYTLNPDNQIFEDHEVNSLALFDEIMNYHMYAICTTKGLNYYKKQLKKIRNEE